MELLYTNENGDLMVDRELAAAGSRGTEVIKASDFIPCLLYTSDAADE